MRDWGLGTGLIGWQAKAPGGSACPTKAPGAGLMLSSYAWFAALPQSACVARRAPSAWARSLAH